MNQKDTYGVIILIILYLYQGLVLGLPGGAIQIILSSKGYEYNQIGIFSFCIIPFTLKFIWSPILDYYYIDRFGKRKTYIIPCTLLMSMILLYLSSEINLLIEQHSIVQLLLFFLSIIFLLATIDIAVDGWALTLVSEENIGVCSACQNFGQQFGWFFSQHIFILLNSVQFSNQHLNTIESEEPYLSLSKYLIILAIVGVIQVVWLIVGTSEINPEIQYEINSLWEEVNLIKGLFTNRYLYTVCIILLVKRIGLGTMETVGPVFLVRNGFPKETLSKISLAAFPFVFAIPFLVGKYGMGNKKENKVCMIALCIAVLNMIIFAFSSYLYINGHKESGGQLISICLFCTEAIKRVFYTVSFAFIFQISEAQVGGIQISVLASIGNFSRVVLDPLFITLVAFIPYHIILVCGIIQQLWFIKKYGRNYIKMQHLPKEVWNLQNDKYIEMQ